MFRHLQVILSWRRIRCSQGRSSGAEVTVIHRSIFVERVPATLELLDILVVFHIVDVVWIKWPLSLMINDLSTFWSKISTLQLKHHLLVSFSNPIELCLLFLDICFLFFLVFAMLLRINKSKGHSLFFWLTTNLLNRNWVTIKANLTCISQLLFGLTSSCDLVFCLNHIVFGSAVFMKQIFDWYMNFSDNNFREQPFLDTGYHIDKCKLDRLFRIINVKLDIMVERPSNMILWQKLSFDSEGFFDDASLSHFLLFGVFDGSRFFLICDDTLFEVTSLHVFHLIKQVQFGWCAESFSVVINFDVWVKKFDWLIRISVLQVVNIRINNIDFQSTDWLGLLILFSFRHI